MREARLPALHAAEGEGMSALTHKSRARNKARAKTQELRGAKRVARKAERNGVNATAIYECVRCKRYVPSLEALVFCEKCVKALEKRSTP